MCGYRLRTEKIYRKTLKVILSTGINVGKKLIDFLKENPELLSVSAPQIGLNVRVFAIKSQSGYKYFVNPKIMFVSKNITSLAKEYCSSFPGEPIEKIRYFEIKITADNLKSPAVFYGYDSVLIQHELSHLLLIK